MQLLRGRMAALLCCVLCVPMLGCGDGSKQPAKSNPSDPANMKSMQELLPPPSPGGQIPGGKK